MENQASKSRHRWKRCYLTGLVLLVMLSGYAAWAFRPLNPEERRLIGIWEDESEPNSGCKFNPDRTIDLIIKEEGRWNSFLTIVDVWRLRWSVLTVRKRIWPQNASFMTGLAAWVKSALSSNSSPIQWEGDKLVWDGRTYRRDPPPSHAATP
jgi:hypothetical protein